MASSTPQIPLRALLSRNLVLSTGCTEPVAIALTVAHAARAAEVSGPESVRSIDVRIKLGLYKNALSVRIPNTGGRSGVPLAAALGLFCRPDDGLSLFASLSDGAVERAEQVVAEEVVRAHLMENGGEMLCVASVETENHSGRAILAGAHDRIVALERDGEPLPVDSSGAATRMALPGDVSLEEILGVIEEAGDTELEPFREGLRVNRAAVRKARALSGDTIGRMFGTTDVGRMAARVASASEARMAGWNVPIMTSCGSGNQGIQLHLGIDFLAESRQIDEARTLRALALAHLVTLRATERLGLVGPLCGLFTKAGLGLAAGFCYLLGGDAAACDRAIRLMAASTAGTMCDGAKTACALKLATAIVAAHEAAEMALQGFPIEEGPGIGRSRAEAVIDHLGRLSRAMAPADRALFQILKKEAE